MGANEKLSYGISSREYTLILAKDSTSAVALATAVLALAIQAECE